MNGSACRTWRATEMCIERLQLWNIPKSQRLQQTATLIHTVLRTTWWTGWLITLRLSSLKSLKHPIHPRVADEQPYHD